MQHQNKIMITVCTRSRPKMLSKLLDSAISMKLVPEIDTSFLVVENDTEKKSYSLVCEKQAQSKNLKIFYSWEPRLGIPIARNHCLDFAKKMGATHIAFVDDDEWFPEDWLQNIWSYYKTTPPATVIQGPVIPVFQAGTSEHLKQFFYPKQRKTGQQLHMCATNNVLVPFSIFSKHDLRFDETHPMAGGTDSKLFRAARAKGVDLVFCSDAHVYEEIPKERATYKWLTKRHFRVGLTIGEHTEFNTKLYIPIYIASRIRDTAWRSIKTAYYCARGNKTKQAKSWIKACRSAGELLGPVGVRVDSYNKIQGS